AAAAAQACDDAVDQWVVRGAVDLRDVEPVLGGGKPGDLPIADVAAKQDHPAAGRQRAVEMLDASRLDPAAGIEHPDMPQMRVLDSGSGRTQSFAVVTSCAFPRAAVSRSPAMSLPR